MPERPPSPLRGYGGQPPPVWRLRTVARRAIAGRAEVAKGGTRTPIAFRLPDPKSGASASSATFARSRSNQPVSAYHGPRASNDNVGTDGRRQSVRSPHADGRGSLLQRSRRYRDVLPPSA